MAAPPGAWQRAAFVAVPLALVVLIFVTPSLIGQEQPATDIPFLLLQATGRAWNETVNETVLVYVRSALGIPLYEYVAINVTGAANLSANQTLVPSLWLKFPIGDAQVANVTAVAVTEDATFRYNATVEFAWDDAGWVLRVEPEDGSPREFRDLYTAAMVREVEA